jgi:integrase/recombinase XerD
MALGKQAKTLTPRQEAAVLAHLAGTRYATRDRAMFLLSVKAGLRAKEIAMLTWAMVTDSDGNVSDRIELQNRASKGKRGGRVIQLNRDLRAALVALHAERGTDAKPTLPVIYSERARGLSANAVAVWFLRLYDALGMEGCSSHSGRRTFVTRLANRIVEAGGSLRDVQELAGHSSLATTQRYIQTSVSAKRKAINLI